MNREQVVNTLRPIEDFQIRRIAKDGGARVLVNPETVAIRPSHHARIIELTKEGVVSMEKIAGIPDALVGKLSPDTFGRVATEALGHRRSDYSVLMKDGRIVEFDRHAEFHPAKTTRVLDTIEKAVGQVEYQRVLVLPNQVGRIEMFTIQEAPVSRGELVRAGAVVTFSPIGTTAPQVQSYVNVLACTNGAISETVLRKYGYGGDGGSGEGDSVWQWFRHSVREAVKSLNTVVEQWKNLKMENLAPGDRAALLEALIKRAKLPDDTANAVRARALEHPPTTAYDAMQLLTWASTHAMSNREPARIMLAQQTAADFANEEAHARICPACHRKR